MAWTLTILMLVAAAGETKTLDCYCTDSTGQRVELGQTACLTVGGREWRARCEMVLNTPAWRDMREGCGSAPTG